MAPGRLRRKRLYSSAEVQDLTLLTRSMLADWRHRGLIPPARAEGLSLQEVAPLLLMATLHKSLRSDGSRRIAQPSLKQIADLAHEMAPALLNKRLSRFWLVGDVEMDLQPLRERLRA